MSALRSQRQQVCLLKSLSECTTSTMRHADTAAPCRVEDVPLSDKAFKAAYNDKTNVKWGADGSMSLLLSGVQGTRLQSLGGKNTYGMYQVKGRIPCAEGVVTAFYVSAWAWRDQVMAFMACHAWGTCCLAVLPWRRQRCLHCQSRAILSR